MASWRPQPFGPSEAFEAELSLHSQGRLREAERAYRSVLKSDPEHSSAWHHLGVVKAQQGNLKEAIRLIRRAIEKQPESAEAHNDLGVALESVEQQTEAAACYERALALRPDYVEALYNLGNALRGLGRHEEAITRFRDALGLRPDHAEALAFDTARLCRHLELAYREMYACSQRREPARSFAVPAIAH